MAATRVSTGLHMSRVATVVPWSSCNKQVTNLDEVLSQLEDEKNRHDELGDLTQSFIVMANTVKQKMVEIREMNVSLED